MTARRIPDDDYIMHLRKMFAKTHSHELEFVLTPEGGAIEGADFFTRAINYHTCMTPWIESVFALPDMSVLEIGCGSGAATLALAQRCGHVDAFDINETSLAEARGRMGLAKVSNVDLHRLDPEWALAQRIAQSRSTMRPRYDVVLLPAVLEHMQMYERLPVLEFTWSLLRPGGIMVVYDTPNRLHPFDMHSFRLPFFNWLPDDLALLYAAHSPRTEFPRILDGSNDPKHMLYRLGRGVSYHEFDLAIGLGEMEILQDGYSDLLTHRAISSGFEGMLIEAFRQHAPHVPSCFSREFLEFIVRKKWDKIRLGFRRGITDSLLDGVRPAQIIEGSDAVLEYELGETASNTVVIEVLRHPWSSELQISVESGERIHCEVLTKEFAIVDMLQVKVPPKSKRVRLQVAPHANAQGNQAWILGVGLA